jgi:hypothetical protein
VGLAGAYHCLENPASTEQNRFPFYYPGQRFPAYSRAIGLHVQPLMMSYPKVGKFKWINVFSRNNIVSGGLKFYDLPG